MKWYHWLGIAIGVYLIFFRKKSLVSNTLPASAGPKITQIVMSQDPGNAAQFDTNPSNYVAVTDPNYPGWYRSKVDGSWYNPSTGDFYSAGSSPVAAAQYGAYSTGQAQLVTFDLADVAAQGAAAAAAAVAANPNNPDLPSNGYVIY